MAEDPADCMVRHVIARVNNHNTRTFKIRRGHVVVPITMLSAADAILASVPVPIPVSAASTHHCHSTSERKGTAMHVRLRFGGDMLLFQ